MIMRIGLIIIGLGTLTVMELGTSPRAERSFNDQSAQLAINTKSFLSETLSAADRLEVHRLPGEPAVRPTTPEITLPVAMTPEENTGTAFHNKKVFAEKPNLRKDKAEPKPKRTASNRAQTKHRPAAAVELTPCRPNAFDSLLQALKLPTRCRT